MDFNVSFSLLRCWHSTNTVSACIFTFTRDFTHISLEMSQVQCLRYRRVEIHSGIPFPTGKHLLADTFEGAFTLAIDRIIDKNADRTSATYNPNNMCITFEITTSIPMPNGIEDWCICIY